MKVLHCRDIGERTCNFSAEAERSEDVERIMLDHTMNRHKTFYDSLDQDEREHFLEQMDAMMSEESEERK